MRVRLFLILFISMILSTQCFTTYAAPVGSSHVIPQGKVEVGVEYNKIFEEALNSKNSGDVTSMKIASDQVYATLGYGLFQDEVYGFDFTAKLGAANLTTKYDGTDNSQAETDESMGFLWGIAPKFTYNLEKPYSLVLHIQYNEWRPSFDDFKYNGTSLPFDAGSKKTRVQDFQTAILLNASYGAKSQNGFNYNLYIGPSFKWLNTTGGTITVAGDEYDLSGGKTKNRFGLVLGMDVLSLSDALKINLEGRLISEYAMTISIHYYF